MLSDWLYSCLFQQDLRQVKGLICKEFNHTDMFVQGAIPGKNIALVNNVDRYYY